MPLFSPGKDPLKIVIKSSFDQQSSPDKTLAFEFQFFIEADRPTVIASHKQIDFRIPRASTMKSMPHTWLGHATSPVVF